MKRDLNALAVLALVGLARTQEQPPLADVQTLQIAKDLRPISATCADIDGDGAREVLVAVSTRGHEGARSIQIWRSARGAQFTLADTLPLTPDVVAWAIGDVAASKGDEIVLFNATGVFAWHSSGAPEQRFERLCAADVLWQLADTGQLALVPDCVRDIDGDGLADLALPEPSGYRIVIQRRARTVDEAGAPSAWGIENRLRLPDETDSAGLWVDAVAFDGRNRHKREREVSFTLSTDEDEEQFKLSPLLVQVDDQVPAPFYLDWDADGDLDVLAQMTHHLLVWKQEPRGQFTAAPSLSLALPVDADRNRLLDASYSSHAVDIDGDHRADCVVFAGDQRSDDVRTQGMFFVQSSAQAGKDASAPLFGDGGRPRDVLVFAGFINNPQFADIDGDGLPDLTLRAVRPDLIDQLRSATSKAIEADLFVYRNVKGTLPRQPDLTWHHSIPLERFELSSEFLGDLTGDGISELFVRSDPKELRVLLVRKQPGKGNALSVFDKPLWQLAVDEEAQVQSVRVPPRTKPQLLILEPKQVLFVRFK